jgi:hypothetical protein
MLGVWTKWVLGREVKESGRSRREVEPVDEKVGQSTGLERGKRRGCRRWNRVVTVYGHCNTSDTIR